MPKYTMGDWKAEDGTVMTDRRLIARCIGNGVSLTEEDKANAILIAAAPRLLKTIQKLRQRIELQQTVGQLTGTVKDWNGELDEIDQVIKLATLKP